MVIAYMEIPFCRELLLANSRSKLGVLGEDPSNLVRCSPHPLSLQPWRQPNIWRV